jgi:prolyl oligopeptidase
MKKLIYFLIAGASLSAGSARAQWMSYPESKRVEQKDNYFGVTIEDPYRWLEDDRSEETTEWVKLQNQVTFDYLERFGFREELRERLNSVWNYEKYSAPFKKGKYYFFYKNDGVQNQSVLYIQDGVDGTPRVLIDPNTFSKEGTSSLTNFAVSKDAKYAAYGVSHAGSDWKEFFVIELATGKKLPDHLKYIKFSSIAWEGKGFYYTRYDVKDEKKMFLQKNEFPKVYYHKIGDKQENDKLVHDNKENGQRSYYAGVTEDEKILYLSETETTSGNGLYYRKVGSKGKFTPLAQGFNFDYQVIGHKDNSLLVLTNDNAPKYKLVSINLNNPAKENWTVVIPENEDVLQGITIANNKLVANYLKDVSTRLYVHSMDGKLEHEIKLPGLGIVNSFNGDKDETTAFFTFSTFTAPTAIYKYNVTQNSSEVFKEVKTRFESEEYETQQIFYKSKDGTKIPMFLVHKKGLVKNGDTPVLLYGYGGFNISVTPSFRPENTVFLENGGIYAVANIRGGGEYGKDWHKAGTQLQKQNVFDDFIAAAEYLIEEQYTNPSRIAISGRSNGGLLVGAVMTQRPDLFKVALPGVGVLDMLRYHTFTIGYAWAGDYGRSDDQRHFKNLLKYSPLHNIKDSEYPATMVITADHDDRVVPAHSFKFISELQHKQRGQNPVLIRIDTNAGHGAGKPISKQIDEAVDVWAFVFHHLGMR